MLQILLILLTSSPDFSRKLKMKKLINIAAYLNAAKILANKQKIKKRTSL